jgi:sugar lactone lactonase YvrE
MFRVLAIGAVAAAAAFPQVIDLPQGFQPEGIEVGRGTTFYVGSRVTGAIWRGNLRTGKGDILVPGGVGRLATGIELDRFNRLFVAGAGTGDAYVYNAQTGALLQTLTLAIPRPTPDMPSFINDVVVTRNVAYFTDSQRAVLYRIPIGSGGALGPVERIPITGDFAMAPGFNLNGIVARPNGRTLIAVQSNTGELFRIDPATGVAREISLGGESVQTGDGILLTGRRLYVVQNTMNRVAVIQLSSDFSSGRVITRLSDPDFAVPTTIDDHGRRLYAVNARFGVANPGSATYTVVQLGKPRGGG